MMKTRFGVALGGAGLALLLAVLPGAAEPRGPVDRLTQFFGRQSAPPADIDDDVPVPRVDSGATVRIDRLENRVRELTGQIEQLQFALRQMQEQNRSVPPRRADEGASLVVVATPLPSAGSPAPLRRGDAFDPATQPNAPGVPRQIGTLPTTAVPSSPALPGRLPVGPVDSGAPMDLSGGRIASNGAVVDSPRTGAIVGSALPPAAPIATAPSAPLSASPSTLPVTPGGTVIASHEPFSPKDEFDAAMGFLKVGQYEAAEKGFSTFLQKNPKNRLVPEAVFNLGESYFQRGKHTDAAREYLKISTTYSSSARAPDALLRLGQSLVAFGGKEQACASFAEVGRKYPNASPTVKAAADREAKKNQC